MRPVRAFGLGIAITAVAVSACSTAGGHGRPASPPVTVTGVHASNDRTNLALDIDLGNNSDQEIFAYATVRNVQYDPPSRALQVTLADTDQTEPTGGIFVLPRLVPV